MAINYSAVDEWKKFISDYVIPLKDSAEALVDYWNYLKGKIEGVEVDEIGDDLKPILLGGVDEEGNYLENSIAKFYKGFFGVSLSVELPKYAIAVREGATKGIKGVITQWNEASSPTDKDPFIRFIVNVATQTKKVISIASSRGIIDTVAEPSREIDPEKILEKLEDAIKLIEDFYSNCAKITPNYNEYTLFILSIRTITRRYLNEAYLKDDGVKFSELQSIFGLTSLFKPEIEDRMKREEYTIWHLPEGSLGDEIRKLYEMIWDYSSTFKELLSHYFGGITDLKEEFIEIAKNSVSLSSEILNVEELLTNEAWLVLDDDQKRWVREWKYLSYRYWLDLLLIDLKKRSVSIMEGLDEISSFLFAGLIYISWVKESKIAFKPLKESK